MEDPTTQMGAAPALFVGVRAMGLDGLILVARSAVIGIAVASGNRPAPREAPRSDLRGLAVTYLPRLALPHGRVLPRPAASGAGWCWGVVAGAALTIDPPQTNRLVMTPPLCVFAAIGLVAVARLA